MTTPRTQAIRRAFARAAAGYDSHADLQRQVADTLAGHIAALGLPDAAAILEIGCGTGLLTRHLAAGAPALLVATDLALPMLAECRRRVPGCLAAAMDGQDPGVAPARFDLLAASLVLQWFADPAAALAAWSRALRPGGRIAVATLAQGSLREWHDACGHAGIASPVADYPPAGLLRAVLPGTPVLHAQDIAIAHPSARAFLRGLRGIGAGVPRPGHAPASPAGLRRAMAAFDAAGAVATYRVVHALAVLPGTGAPRRIVP